MGLACLAEHLLGLEGNYQMRCSTLQRVKLHLLQVCLQPEIRAVQMEFGLRVQTSFAERNSVCLLHCLN